MPKPAQTNYENNYLQHDLQRFQTSIDHWYQFTSKLEEPEAMDWARQDRRDLQAVYRAVKTSQYRTAFNRAERLDTLVRDQIPNRLYNFLAKTNGYH